MRNVHHEPCSSSLLSAAPPSSQSLSPRRREPNRSRSTSAARSPPHDHLDAAPDRFHHRSPARRRIAPRVVHRRLSALGQFRHCNILRCRRIHRRQRPSACRAARWQRQPDVSDDVCGHLHRTHPRRNRSLRRRFRCAQGSRDRRSSQPHRRGDADRHDQVALTGRKSPLPAAAAMIPSRTPTCRRPGDHHDFRRVRSRQSSGGPNEVRFAPRPKARVSTNSTPDDRLWTRSERHVPRLPDARIDGMEQA